MFDILLMSNAFLRVYDVCIAVVICCVCIVDMASSVLINDDEPVVKKGRKVVKEKLEAVDNEQTIDVCKFIVIISLTTVFSNAVFSLAVLLLLRFMPI